MVTIPCFTLEESKNLQPEAKLDELVRFGDDWCKLVTRMRKRKKRFSVSLSEGDYKKLQRIARGHCVHDAQILQGSNPLFEVQELVSAAVPESDCLLRHPARDEHVSLWPWLLLEDCPHCLRQMVFLYDRIEPAGVIFREYPNNLCKRNAEVSAEIAQRIR
jgi:hypothetical protein